MIEGLDGTGKTLLAERLSTSNVWPIIHPNDLAAYNHNDWRDDFVIAYTLDKVGLPATRMVLFDRSILSGFAYTLPRNVGWKSLWVDYLLLLKQPIIIIHLVASEEVRKMRDPNPGFLWWDLDELVEEAAKDEAVVAYKRWDSGKHSTEALVKMFGELIRKVEAERVG